MTPHSPGCSAPLPGAKPSVRDSAQGELQPQQPAGVRARDEAAVPDCAPAAVLPGTPEAMHQCAKRTVHQCAEPAVPAGAKTAVCYGAKAAVQVRW